MMRIHGGDWAAYESEYGKEPLDFSANVSPLGMPEGVRRAICRAAEGADRYPDPSCRALRQALSARLGLPDAQILCGNGASDLIWRAAAALGPGRALLPVPSFGEYEAALAANGWEIVFHPCGPELCPDASLLSAITPQTGLLFLCQPGNPAGTLLSPALLRRVLERCRETGCRLILDECFLDLTEDPAAYSLLDALPAHPELLILRAFTKLYGMAGVRLGFALSSDPALLEAISTAGQPWAVSSLAQAAGIAALAETDYVEAVRSLIAAERPRLAEGLAALGLRVVPGRANFLLFHGAAGLDEALAARGILIRSCASYRGLGAGWYRCAVRTREENDRLLSALREVLS